MRVFFSLLSILLTVSLSAEQYVYVSAKGDQTLDIYQFDSSNGKLQLKKKVALKAAPGNSVISPDEKYLYVSLRGRQGKKWYSGIETLEIQKNGMLKSVAYAETPQFCGYLAIDSEGKYLFSSHYGEGKISSYKLEKGLYKGQVLDDIKTDDRAHSIGIDRTNSFVFIPHTAANKVYQFKFKNEKLTKNGKGYTDGPAVDKRYHEPRHLAFHPTKNFIYTSNERGGGLSHWTYDSQGKLTLKQTVCTLPEDNNEKFAASDITISADGRFVYVANRDNLARKNPKGKDCLAAYEVDPSSGKILKKVGSFAVGRHPRCVRIDTTGKYLFGPGVNSSTLTVFRRDQSTGALQALETYHESTNPMWILTLEK